jgi:hypothetical protein
MRTPIIEEIKARGPQAIEQRNLVCGYIAVVISHLEAALHLPEESTSTLPFYKDSFSKHLYSVQQHSLLVAKAALEPALIELNSMHMDFEGEKPNRNRQLFYASGAVLVDCMSLFEDVARLRGTPQDEPEACICQVRKTAMLLATIALKGVCTNLQTIWAYYPRTKSS